MFKPGDKIIYLGKSIGIVCDQKTVNTLATKIGEDRIWAVWDNLSYPQHAAIKDCQLLKHKRSLPDWF